jgi:hypothetical protein
MILGVVDVRLEATENDDSVLIVRPFAGVLFALRRSPPTQG